MTFLFPVDKFGNILHKMRYISDTPNFRQIAKIKGYENINVSQIHGLQTISRCLEKTADTY